MTAYHGGKQRVGKQIAEVIVDESLYIAEDEGWNIQGYCEPFCGMLGVYHHIQELYKDRGLENLSYMAGDTNRSVIIMWNSAKRGWTPPTSMTEKKYNKLRWGPDSAEKGFVGHQYSFGGQYFKGYLPKYGKTSNFPRVVERVRKIARKSDNVVFRHGSYIQYSNLRNYVIYCDPPYANREQCYSESFDSLGFFEWCRKMAENNIVYVSEYKAPQDFEKIWSREIKITGRGVSQKHGNGSHTKRVEKIYLVPNE